MWSSLALILNVALALPAGGVEFFDGSWDSAVKEAAKTKKPLFVDFSTVW